MKIIKQQIVQFWIWMMTGVEMDEESKWSLSNLLEH